MPDEAFTLIDLQLSLMFFLSVLLDHFPFLKRSKVGAISGTAVGAFSYLRIAAVLFFHVRKGFYYLEITATAMLATFYHGFTPFIPGIRSPRYRR